MDSLYKGYPIGYVITWQNPNVRLKDGKLSEGKKILIDYKDRTILEEMKYLEECVQSSISYGGGKDLSCLKSVRWI